MPLLLFLLLIRLYDLLREQLRFVKELLLTQRSFWYFNNFLYLHDVFFTFVFRLNLFHLKKLLRNQRVFVQINRNWPNYLFNSNLKVVQRNWFFASLFDWILNWFGSRKKCPQGSSLFIFWLLDFFDDLRRFVFRFPDKKPGIWRRGFSRWFSFTWDLIEVNVAWNWEFYFFVFFHYKNRKIL